MLGMKKPRGYLYTMVTQYLRDVAQRKSTRFGSEGPRFQNSPSRHKVMRMPRRFRDYLAPNYADEPSKGLYNAKAGDVIEIGMQGTRNKREIKIVAVLASGKLRDAAGNIFNRDGMIYRGAEYWSQGAKKAGRKIYAVPMTKEKNEKNKLKRAQDSLFSLIKNRKDKLTVEQIKAIGKVLNVEFGNFD